MNRAFGLGSAAGITATWVETDEYVPTKVKGWEVINEDANGRWYRNKTGLLACFTLDYRASPFDAEQGSRQERWLHVSVSRRNKLPSWDDLRLVKDTFLPDWTAYQILPPKEEHVNIHPYCLHLWVCLDRQVTPDFRTMGQI